MSTPGDEEDALKILIISWYFPPVNTIGAVRVGKFARFLVERGHDVGVVSGKYWCHPENLPLGVPLDRIIYAESVDVNSFPGKLARWATAVLRPENAQTDARPNGGTPAAGLVGKSPARRASELYQHLTNLPDNRVGWLPWAYGAARRMCRDWQPDLVFGSGPPFTALVACRALSARLDLPWVAELRDRWADDPYGEQPRWRSTLDAWIERRVLSHARALVTVTEPWAEFYRQKYGKPVAPIYNGYDPLDFGTNETVDQAASPYLVVGYTGGIYPGKRDPTPLFAALKMLGERGERFRVVFCGTDPAQVLPLAESAGVAHLVEVRPAVPNRQSLDFQRQSDVLLLMQWNDPREQGNCPGKFFEYMASLRPILILGLEDGVPATIARRRSAGFCINEATAIAEQLIRWLGEKEEFGRVKPLPVAAREGLSRTIQFEKLEQFLSELVAVGRH
jgi:hypothetical protein